MSTVPDEIRSALVASTISNRKIARKARIHYANLAHFKSGKIGLGLKPLARLAAVLGLSIVVTRAKRPRKLQAA